MTSESLIDTASALAEITGDGEMEESDSFSETVDAFPSHIYDITDWGDLERDMKLFTCMETIKTYKEDTIPVIPYKTEYALEEDENRFYQRVVFYNLIQDRDILLDRFLRLYENASRRNALTGHEEVSWSTMEKKMLKEPRVSHRIARAKTNKTDGLNRKGNADNRQSFVYQCQHLVKKDVTNGVRTTPVFDIYIIFSVPLLIYQQVTGPVCPEGSFYASTKKLFKPFLIQPLNEHYTIYCVRPQTTYLTVSLQKTCYSILRMTENAFAELVKRYAVYDAFQENNLFVPQSKNVLKALSESQALKRKRGRPTKSLDKIYWYKNYSSTVASIIQNTTSSPTVDTVAPTTTTPSATTHYHVVSSLPVECILNEVEDENVLSKRPKLEDPFDFFPRSPISDDESETPSQTTSENVHPETPARESVAPTEKEDPVLDVSEMLTRYEANNTPAAVGTTVPSLEEELDDFFNRERLLNFSETDPETVLPDMPIW